MWSRSFRLFLILEAVHITNTQWGLMWNPPQTSSMNSPTVSSVCGGALESTGCGSGCQSPRFPPEPKNTCTNVLRCKCHSNSDGFMCCNPELEQFLRCVTSNPCNQQKWRGANLQRMATDVQKMLEEQFKRSFEVISGSSEFCGRHSFKGDMMCKIKTPDCKTLMAYASPQQYSTNPCCPNSPISPSELASRATGWGADGFQNTDI